MRSSALLCLVPVALCAAASPSPANVTISNAATANMTCSGGVCSPTAADAVLNVQGLEAMLASGNAKITTTGAGVQAKDIQVKAPLTWSAVTTLALDAYRSIDVNAKVSVVGRGGVSLTTNDGGSGGDFACNDSGRVALSSLSSALSINGTRYLLVDSVASLANAIAAAGGRGSFALAKNYNAKKDGTYPSSPIAAELTGSFNGLGNTISNLSVNDSSDDDEVGFFAETEYGSLISNVRLTNESVQATSAGNVGGLVGSAGGAIAHSLSTGMVSGGGSVGGLIGAAGGVVSSSGSAAVVSAPEVYSGGFAGGLIGSTGAIYNAINDSWATGNVSVGNSGGYVGGLVGYNVNTAIQHSWASGQVSAPYAGVSAGGLVGYTNWTIDRSYATGAVTCLGYWCGGLVGYAEGDSDPYRISESWATGNVNGTGSASVGGLVGYSEFCSGVCNIVNSYASGAVSGTVAGGLVGMNGAGVPHASISGSYATGVVNGTNTAGGLIGCDCVGPLYVKHSYWDVTTSGITNRSEGSGTPANDPGIKGLTDKELKSGLPKGFDPAIWKEDSSINNGWPYLINNPPPN